MLSKKVLAFATVFFATATTAAAGVFEIEVPADLTREDVLNPTAAVKARLEALMREEVAKHPAEANCAPVGFTKDGELIYPEVGREAMDDWSDNGLTFIPAPTGENRFLWPEFEGSWEAAVWHLHEVGRPEKDGVYELAEDMFGYPFRDGVVFVEWDPTLPEEIEGFYYIETYTIYLRQWRDWQDERYKMEPNNPNWNDDAAVLTRCMLQAWHHAWPAYWDHFASMGCAAWIAIHNWLGDRGYELGFNDLYHDDQRVARPYYKCLDNYNTEELASRLNNWAHHEFSQIDDRIKYWRYGAAGFCWWKVYRKQPGFMWCFNQKLYVWLVTHLFQRPKEYGDYKKFAVDVYTGDDIEGRGFLEWFDHQPILRNDGWCDDICALAVDRTTARVLAYRRYRVTFPPVEIEEAHYPAGVVIEKKDWEGEPLGSQGVDVNSGGYGEWDFPVHNPNEGIQVKARLNLGAGDITDSRWAIDSDAAYEADALYGVVTDAFGGAGSVTIKKGGVEQATVPVFGNAFRWTPESPRAPGEYELVYYPPRGTGGRSYTPQKVLKDVASYFSERCYTYDAWLADVNKNGIPDEDEQDFARKFVPHLRMHNGNDLMPQNVGIYVDPGRGPLVKYVFDTSGHLTDRVPYWPTEEYTMEQIFEDTRPYWDYPFYKWALVFGPDYDNIEEPDYWHSIYFKLAEEYDTATIYYDIFNYQGKPVIQYWFFYPFNDWANDHEGDWEHINVRITSPDLQRAELDEVLYYFHEKFKPINGASVPLAPGTSTHPLVYVGGRADVIGDNGPRDDWGNNSGGSYFRTGKFINVGPPEYPSVDEWIDEPCPEIPWYYFNNPQHHLERLVRNDRDTNLWWSEFPKAWGRLGFDIGFGQPWGKDPPNSPMHHECWKSYHTPGYEEYSEDLGVTSYPPLATDGEQDSPSEAAPFESPFTGLPLSPSIGEYQSPSAGDYPSPVASSGGGADTPGDDSAPPSAATPAAFGGDSGSGRAAAAGFGRGGPLAATPAEPLSCSPNPVSCAATITFKVEAPCRVNLAIYDISGRRVATLADGPYAPGEHSASWQADVPAGVYIYRLRAGDKVAVKKLVVTR
jgi:hypothetical protein